eukprot:PhM_4_TR16671/c0_g2_i1/m.92921
MSHDTRHTVSYPSVTSMLLDLLSHLGVGRFVSIADVCTRLGLPQQSAGLCVEQVVDVLSVAGDVIQKLEGSTLYVAATRAAVERRAAHMMRRRDDAVCAALKQEVDLLRGWVRDAEEEARLVRSEVGCWAIDSDDEEQKAWLAVCRKDSALTCSDGCVVEYELFDAAPTQQPAPTTSGGEVAVPRGCKICIRGGGIGNLPVEIVAYDAAADAESGPQD